jgi:hypothetical protein
MNILTACCVLIYINGTYGNNNSTLYTRNPVGTYMYAHMCTYMP